MRRRVIAPKKLNKDIDFLALFHYIIIKRGPNNFFEEDGVMKKNFALLLAAVFLLISLTILSAQEGFTGPRAGHPLVTVEQAKRMPDDALVTLQGYIINSLGDEKYTFRDNTGEIMIEIDRRVWRGVSAGENDKVEISGEVEHERTRVEIDVKSIRRL